jgi:very-short-patch-repair endonuclease
LENLQGDERDVIFIGYTYGPEAAGGSPVQRFGPVTGEHGWRRLNVLITRSRRRLEVFTSMRSEQIVGGPEKSRGVNAMKDFLAYVETGNLIDRGVVTGRGADSPFEEAVGRVIGQQGLRWAPQVGVAGYFLDIGVLAPDRKDEFILGIECDGATYHSAKSARDRDRLREEVIRRRGWNIHRIWSTDWFLNQEAEERRLSQALTDALKRWQAHTPSAKVLPLRDQG